VAATLIEMNETKKQGEAQQHVSYSVCHVKNNTRNDLKINEKGNQIRLYVTGCNLLHENRKHREDEHRVC
jgi:hypothetical protein